MISRAYLIVACATGLALGPSLHAETADVTVDHNVQATMRDGLALSADIYRPNREGKFPVLLQRTPYNKAAGSDFGNQAASRGFVAIIQDVRGRFTSPGEWYPFLHESEDGYDTVEWAAALPYSNGKVGMWGGSYVGATQMLTAIAHPPHLAGISPVVTASNYHSNWTYQGGAFEQWFNQSWTSGLAQDTLNRRVVEETNAMRAVTQTPLTAYPLFYDPAVWARMNTPESLAPYYTDWLAHPNFDNYWKRWSIEDHYADIDVPALHTAAWYDIFQGGSIRNYEGLRQHAGTDAARKGQRLLIIIGGHAGGGQNIGDVDFGADAATYTETASTLDWYDFLFKGVQNGFAKHPVRLFVMGANQWRDEDEWPLNRARPTKFLLQSKGGANSLRGDGILALDAKRGTANADRYSYDPLNPVPTVGGPLCCDPKHLPAGPRDQRVVEARDDVLVYSTAELEHDLEVTGQVSLQLYARSSAIDTDFTAKLVDVWPDGRAINLTEGILRTSYRDSQDKPEMLNPGQVYLFKIDLWSTGNVFRKGHRVRLEISSSNFPRFDRNFNTGMTSHTETRGVNANNIVLHDPEHPSALILPIVEQAKSQP